MATFSALDKRVFHHLCYKIANATLNLYPYPHFYITDVFPADFYATLARTVAAATGYQEKPGHYHGRQFGCETLPNEIDGLRGLSNKAFAHTLLSRFAAPLEELHKRKDFTIYFDLRFIRDGLDYFIGPHTDAPWKLLSLLFYLPLHHMYERYGTSIYVPNDPTFRCPGGPHHDFDAFTQIWTAPFRPNTLFAFVKTPNSFHGVPRIDTDFQRDVLLYNIYDKEIYEQTHEKPSNAHKDEHSATSATPET